MAVTVTRDIENNLHVGINHLAVVYYDRVMQSAVDDELVKLIKKAVHEEIENSEELKKELRVAVIAKLTKLLESK